MAVGKAKRDFTENYAGYYISGAFVSSGSAIKKNKIMSEGVV